MTPPERPLTARGFGAMETFLDTERFTAPATNVTVSFAFTAVFALRRRVLPAAVSFTFFVILPAAATFALRRARTTGFTAPREAADVAGAVSRTVRVPAPGALNVVVNPPAPRIAAAPPGLVLASAPATADYTVAPVTADPPPKASRPVFGMTSLASFGSSPMHVFDASHPNDGPNVAATAFGIATSSVVCPPVGVVVATTFAVSGSVAIVP